MKLDSEEIPSFAYKMKAYKCCSKHHYCKSLNRSQNIDCNLVQFYGYEEFSENWIPIMLKDFVKEQCLVVAQELRLLHKMINNFKCRGTKDTCMLHFESESKIKHPNTPRIWPTATHCREIGIFVL